jgi:hypothetical protein
MVEVSTRVISKIVLQHVEALARLFCALALTCVALLPTASWAQATPLPILTPTQTLTPTDEETYSSPGAFPNALYFGGTVALDERNVLVSMSGYNSQTGRIAVFGKGANNQWVRTGNIDPTPQLQYDYFGGLVALDHGYLMVTAGTGTSLFRREQERWTQTDKLAGVLAWQSTGQTINPPWAFIVGDVYRITPHGKLQKTGQTLSDEVPPTLTSFGATDASDGNTLAIGDTSYNNEEGAVYVFELEHGQWVQKQQLVTSDGVSGDAFSYGISIAGDLMAITASGRNLRYEDPNCPGTYYTGGSVYIFERINGQWTQQQEIDADCTSFSNSVQVNREWLAVNAAGADNIVYHRSHERGSQMFEAFGHTGTDIQGYGMKLFGSTMVVGSPGLEFPPGQAYVYDLRYTKKKSD